MSSRQSRRQVDSGPVTVAHVTTVSESLEVLLLNQLRAITRSGFGVVGVSAPGNAVARIERAGIQHISAPFVRATGLTPGSDLKLFANLVRLFRRERFTIVHTHTAKPDLFASIAARVAGVPIVITTLHGFYFHDLMPKRARQFYVGLARLGMRACDVVLSQNAEDVETARRERICASSKIELLGNGIDIERFDRKRIDPQKIASLRAALGIRSDDLIVGFVGRLVAEKGVLELLEAMQLVQRRHPDVRLLLVGGYDEAKQDAIRPETAARYGLTEIAIFTGHRTDTPELYSLMDVCVLPSHREGFPRTPMEASAMGVPVVATDIRGCRSAVDHDRTGLLVRAKNVPRLAEALATLLSDPQRRRTMGTEGRKVAEARFDERLVFRKVIATYERLLAARGMSSS